MISDRDRVRHRDHELDHRCQQVVTANADGRIVAIRHVNLPGEPEKAKAFNARCGTSKPG